jgi:hypothetical protein
MNDKSKQLKKMATWTIAVFATVFAVVMALFWLLVYPVTAGSVWNVLGAALRAGWLIFVIAAVVCLATFFSYKFYLERKK